jgi:lipopolysaccharide/colanic/teichoic acid biosynthesis glycosyltransferase
MNKQETNVQPQSGGARPRLPFWKRILDLTLILMISPGLLLLGGLVALLIKLGSPGPIFFRQRRIGFRGSELVCCKFRTMRVDADADSHRWHTQELIRSQTPMVKLDAHRDPRMIPFGSLLRVSGLDELPQLINVLRGEMSLVGPRPCIPYECEAYEPWHWQRFDAVPGLTGLWQVSGKNRTTFDQMVRLDIAYSQRLSLWLDLRIILKTIPALWCQYCDLRGAKCQSTVRQSTGTSKSVEPYRAYENIGANT